MDKLHHMLQELPKQRASWVALVIYSVVGAFTALVGSRVVRTEWFYSGNYEQNFFPGLHPTDLFTFVGLFAGTLVLTCGVLALYRFLLGHIPLRERPVSPRIIFVASWLVIFVCWMPYFLVNFPGVIMADSIVIIKQALGINPLTTHHPLAYTGLIWLCLHVGDALFGGYVPGIAIYTLLQMLFMSASFAYLVSWMARRRIPFPALVVVVAVVALSSVFSLHAVSFWKDGIYASFMLLLAIGLFDSVAQPERLRRPGLLLRLALLGLAVCLARTNGVFVMLLVWPALIVVGKGVRGRVAAAAVASMVVFTCVVGIAGAALGAKSEPLESYGIPLQQAAAVVVYEGTMTEDQRAFMNSLLPLEDYRGEYLPCSVDGIKWADNFDEEFFNEHQLEFIKTWAAMLPHNLGIYINAYIMESYEYWTYGDVYRNLHVNYVNDKYDAPDLGIVETNLMEKWFGERVAALFPFRFATLGEGAVSWIVLFAGLLLFVARREKWAAGSGARMHVQGMHAQGKYVQGMHVRPVMETQELTCKLGKTEFEPFARAWWLVVLPAVASWLTVLVSSPFAALPRYVLPSIFLLPLIVFLPWLILSCAHSAKHYINSCFSLTRALHVDKIPRCVFLHMQGE